MDMDYGWYFVGHKPTRLEYGKRVNDHLENVVASIERLSNGEWYWNLIGHPAPFGTEKSREMAMNTANRFLERQ